MEEHVLLIRLKEPVFPTQKVTYMPPIGLYSLRSTIWRKNKEAYVHICDMHMGDDLESYLNMDKKLITLIGISCQFSIQHDEYLRVAALCKKLCPDIFLIAGGFHASAVPTPDNVDDVVSGYGEVYFDLNIRTTDDLPIPEFGVWEMDRYWAMDKPHDIWTKSKHWMPIETSRGCYHKCGFCGVHRFSPSWAGHSMTWLEKYLTYLEGQGIEELLIEDDNVFAKKHRLEDITNLFSDFNLKWSTPNGVAIRSIMAPGDIGKIGDSGCWRLSLPFETGSKDTAELMNLGRKWVDYEEAYNVVLELKKNEIVSCGFFIIGYPGETLEDMKETIMFANALPLDQRNIYIASPYPGTPLYDLCQQKGYLITDYEDLYRELLYTKGLIKTDDFTPEQVEGIKFRDRERARLRNYFL